LSQSLSLIPTQRSGLGYLISVPPSAIVGGGTAVLWDPEARGTHREP